jgi:hypothetical protein
MLLASALELSDASKAYMWYRIVNQSVSRGKACPGAEGTSSTSASHAS